MNKPIQDIDFPQQPPFNLNEAALTWVPDTFSALDEGARITQLFCFRSDGDAHGEHDYLTGYKPGGIIRTFNTERDVERQRIDALNDAADVPLLVAPTGRARTRLTRSSVHQMQNINEYQMVHGRYLSSYQLWRVNVLFMIN